ncbi:phosphorylase family protein [Nostoc sp. 'Peltigera membranacea cyanobiont' 232]|uniref:WD40 domain-containing protein n=1 Tax=Nostoc sp. 'Peltigera membranacea cyanobiont' 232 TaxID=2014531 RepID=UPI000B958C19|nr:pentapeptide repeat-containing protein [Nostoc sp. 'Peltigera membranacea cyanobiont' 232]OYE03689.1 hypothetical protein CDG79_17100 [Nostoc sp. 'Peltigera membranacea cyanobiont' 232]
MPIAVILTALSVEYLALHSHLTDIQEKTSPLGMVYEQGNFIGNRQEWKVGIAEVGAGNIGAALAVERAISYFKPNIIFFVGIAGGIKDVAIGDVVAATDVYNYESGKVGEQFFTRPTLGKSTDALVQIAKSEARKSEWLQRLSDTPVSQPSVFVAPIAAGEKVVASRQSDIFQLLRTNYNDAIAVEMEGFGFLSAVFAHPNIKAIVIRGISDLIENKNDDSIETEIDRHNKASRHAAAFAFEILANFQLEDGNGTISEVESEDANATTNTLISKFENLNDSEKELLYLFAIEYNDFLTLKNLREKLFAKESSKLKDNCKIHLDELVKENFLIQDADKYILQSDMYTHVRKKFINEVSKEIQNQQLRLLKTHLLFSAQSEPTIKTRRINDILIFLKKELLIKNTEEEITKKLSSFLVDLNSQTELLENYAAGNILNILLQLNLKKDFSNFNLSNITVAHADLQDAFLEQANFINSDLTQSKFCEPLGCIHSIAFSADGTYFATGDAHGSIRIHNTENRRLCVLRNASHSQIWSIIFSPNNQKLASCTEDGSLSLWVVDSISDDQEITLYPDSKPFPSKYNGRILSVAFSWDGNILAIGVANIGIILQNVEISEPSKTLIHENVHCLAFNKTKNNTRLVSGSNNGSVKLWDIDSKESKDLKKQDNCTVRCLTFSPDGRKIASGGEDGKVRLWSDSNNWVNLSEINCKPIEISDPKIKQVRALAFSHDGKTLAIGCIDNESATHSSEHTIRLWSVEEQRWLEPLLNAHTHLIRSLAFCPKPERSNLLISGGDGRTIKFWDIQKRECIDVIKGYANRIWSITPSFDCKTFASCGEDSKIRILEQASNYKCIQSLSKHTDWVWSVAFNPNNDFLASGSEDHNILLWERNGENWEYKTTLKSHQERVRCVAFSPNNELLASTGNDKKVIIWDMNYIRNSIEKDKIIRDEFSHKDRVLSVAFSPNSQYIASSSRDKVIKLKNLVNKSFINFNETHDDQVHTIGFSLNNRTLVSGSFDKTLKIWHINSQNCTCIQTLKGHSAGILSVAFHPKNNNIVASAGHDRTIKLWNINNARCLSSVNGHKGTVESVTFSLDGKYLLSSSQDQTIKIWNISKNYDQINHIQTIELRNLYQDMKIAGIRGLSESQKSSLIDLGADSNVL